MKELEALKVSDTTQVDNRIEDESVLSKLSREAWVLGAGLVHGAKSGVDQIMAEPGDAVFRLGLAAGIGCILGASQRTAGLARLGLEAVGLGVGIAFCRDVLRPQRWSDVKQALGAAWDSPANTDRSVALIGNQLGRFAFDTVLLSGVGLGAAKIGQKYLSAPSAGYKSFDTGGYVSSYDRMILEKMSRSHPY